MIDYIYLHKLHRFRMRARALHALIKCIWNLKCGIKLKRGENEGVRVAVGPYEIVLGCLASRQISGPRVIEHQSLNAWYNPKKCLFLIRKFVLELNEILIVSSFLLHPGDCTIVSSRQISTCK